MSMMIDTRESLFSRLTAGAPFPAPGRATGDRIVTYLADTIRDTAPTPLADVRVVVDGCPRTILLKLDGHSRWGSMKGRTALALLASVAGRVDERTTIVESTSGNLGVALAGICREIGLPFTAVVDSRLPPVLRSRLTEYQTRIDEVAHVEDSRHLQRRLARVRDIVRHDPHAVWPNQYENPANVAVHRWWTGPELDSQVGSDLQVVFSPVSTGGSFVGLRAFMAAARPQVRCVAVDVVGSTIFGGSSRRRLLTGIGASRRSTFIDRSGRPPHLRVSDDEAIATCRTLAADAGIAIGGSSGATVAACLRYLADHPDVRVALCMCPDLGSNYTQTLYDDEWLARSGAAGALRRPSAGGRAVHFAGSVTPVEPRAGKEYR
jgi:cysteine synthase A